MTPARDKSYDYDVIVVGGALVGASLALALAESGLRIAVLDGQDFRLHAHDKPLAGQFDPRVSAITPASCQFLEQLGVWQEVLCKRATAYTDMQVWDADGSGSIHFSAYDIHADALGHIVENSVLLAALYTRLADFPTIEILAPARLLALRSLPTAPSSGSASVRLQLEDGRELSTALLVAADGANSKVRELAGFQTREWDYEHHAIVTTVRTALPHQRTAIQRFMDAGTLAFLPLSEGADEQQHYCSIVWSVLPEFAQRLLEMNEAQFAQALEYGIESRLGAIEWSDKRFSVPLRQRHAKSYVQSGIALIGDAAHTIHPLAGQGVNLGFLDAAALAEEILRAQHRRLSLGDLHVLRRYQRQRIGHNLGMMWVMEGFKHLFADQGLGLRWLRNAGMSGLDSAPALKNRVMRAAMGLDAS